MGAPKRGKRYQQIVERGCGLRHYPYQGDWDCDHKYEWDCDECPVAVEARKHQEGETTCVVNEWLQL